MCSCRPVPVSSCTFPAREQLLWSDRRGSGSKGGWEEECPQPFYRDMSVMLKMLGDLVLHCEV